MAAEVTRDALEAAYQKALAALLAERHPDGYWIGELSSSALATATAVSALALVRKHTGTDAYQKLIDGGLAWLIAHQNADGGWGDTVKSFSNISTTMLCRAAIYLALSPTREQGGPKTLAGASGSQAETSHPSSARVSDPAGFATEDFPAASETCGRPSGGVGRPAPNMPLAGAAGSQAETLQRAESWLFERYGKTPAELAEAVRQCYGKDRTFAVPILTTCALAGLVPWREVPPLPFELACLPQWMFRFLRLHVVSYALPALIAIGQCVHYHRPPWNPFTRLVRWLAKKKSLRILERIQPSNGGFLEATPLTSFVTLSLAACGQADHTVVRKGVEFIVKSARPDGSWPIDTNLSTWVTTLAVNALHTAGELACLERKNELRKWLEGQQFQDVHPYTDAFPGGWGWTPLPGGVPDADDTAGAIVALSELEEEKSHIWSSWYGLEWLLPLQNRDGGWPTFCQGWGSLPFDRSGSDLTAHALRALNSRNEEAYEISFDLWPYDGWGQVLSWLTLRRKARRLRRGLRYLAYHQRPDGSWLPLWFGNQHAPNDENPTYGTARVLAAYRDLDMMNTEPARRGAAWLLAAQNDDGGWGGCKGCPSSMEETALAVEILLDAGPGAEAAVNNGLAWLVQQVQAGGLFKPTPIGFYFAKLWYFEKLYPIIFTVAALGRARRKRQNADPPPV